MSTAKAIPFSMLALGLALIMLATFSVVQTERMTVSPVEMDLSSLFEPKTGQLTFEAPPYCGQFDLFCFIAFIFRLIFDRFRALFHAIFGGGSFSANAASTTSASQSTVSTASNTDGCAEGRAGRSCRRDQRRAERAQRRR